MRKEIMLSLFVLLLLLIVGFVFSDYSRDLTGYATSDSQVGNLSVGVQTYMACTWSDETLDVDFGSNLNPGTEDINATKNYEGVDGGTLYNVSVDSLSTANADIAISGNDLADGGNVIAVENVTLASSTTSASDNASMDADLSTSLTDSNVDIESDIAPDSDVHYRFWLDIPSDTVAGNYIGNYTMTCQETGV